MATVKPAIRRTPLTRERILRTAVELVERDGAKALSMRRLAKEFGVEAMSLYNHVHGKADILTGISDVVLAEIKLPEQPPASWEEGVRILAGAFRTVALAHPRACELILTRQLTTPVGLRPVELALSMLVNAGFSEETAVHAVRAILAYLMGTLLREVGASPAATDRDPAAVRIRIAELANSGLPTIARVAPLLGTIDHDVEYEFGIEALITALRAGRAGS